MNRSLFFDRLTQALGRVVRRKETAALFYIDVDHFKSVNDSYGHNAGDMLLTVLATRLKNTVRSTDTVSRLGGDEFSVLLENISLPEVHMIAKKLLDAAHKSLELSGQDFLPSISIGFTFIDKGVLPLSDYIKQADNAMYEAKKEGRNTYKGFSSVMAIEIDERIRLGKALMEALSNDELLLYYQPKLCAQTEKILGLEALIRWPLDDELLLPNRILPIIEHLDAMDLLTEWVIHTACQQLSQWLKDFPDLTIGVNITASQLHRNFIKMIRQCLDETHLSAGNLEIEITESHLMRCPEEVIPIIEHLHQLGVKIAVDDFGTGFSSLSYLSQLPIDALKIDRSFVQGIELNSRNSTVIKAIIELAKNLEFVVVAEGIETSGQCKALYDLGTHEYQGYLFSEPLNSDQCYQYLLKQESFRQNTRKKKNIHLLRRWFCLKPPRRGQCACPLRRQAGYPLFEFKYLILVAFQAFPDASHIFLPFQHLTQQYLHNTLWPRNDYPNRDASSNTETA